MSAPAPDPRALQRVDPAEAGGWARLEGYIWERDRPRVYKETRNGMLEPDDSSKLSPWLAVGALSPRQVFDEILRYEDERVRNESTYWLQFELWWRDYFRFVALRAGGTLFRQSGPIGPKKPGSGKRCCWDEVAFDAWRRGETGYPIVDADMQELAATGYLSNRGRQIVASFLVNELALDWRAGAAWFEAQLVDYDPCSNRGNWAYAAGVGHDPRSHRYFDLDEQARRYDPDSRYLRHWLPALQGRSADEARAPWTARELIDYPERIAELRARPPRGEATRGEKSRRGRRRRR